MIPRRWRSLVSAALCVGTLCCLVAGRAMAQAQAPAVSTSAEASQGMAQDLIRGLAPVRKLGAPPTVPQTGLVVRVDGGSAMFPVEAVLAIGDAHMQDEELKSIFPVSQTYHPIDSIEGIRRARASAWVTRLSTVSTAERAYAVQGWQQVPFAEIAARAGNDSMAVRLFDKRIAELASKGEERSYTLYEAIATLADPTQEPARLKRNLVLAEEYLKKLRAIPLTGYKTRHDSAAVLYNQWRIEDTLVVAYTELDDTAAVRAHALKGLSYSPMLGLNERGYPFNLIYRHVVRALDQTPAQRTQLAAFHPQMMAIAHRSATEFPATATLEQQNEAKQLEPNLQHWIDEVMSWLALLNTPGSALQAHLWLATSDSTYAPAPRTRTVADGNVHVLIFGMFYENPRVSIASRTQELFPKGVEVTLVTNTSGSAGPDIVNPKVESEWLTQYLRGVRHTKMQVAIWAAEKEQVGFVPEGHYPVFRPKETPNEKPYHAGMLDLGAAIIDKQGVIRFYQLVDTRRRERKLYERIQMLLDEPAAPAKPATPTAAPAAAATPSASALAPATSGMAVVTASSTPSITSSSK